MVEDIFNMYSAIAAELRLMKEVRFFAVVKMDEITERWSLIFGLVGAKDLDKRQRAFEKIRRTIVANLKPEDIQNVARIGLFSTTEHLVKDLMKFHEGETIESVKANGNFIHKGYVLISSAKAESSDSSSDAQTI